MDSDGDGVSDVSDETPAGLVTQAKQVEFEITYEDEAGNEGIVVDNTTNRSFVRMTQRIRNFWMFRSLPTTWIIPPPGKMIMSL